MKDAEKYRKTGFCSCVADNIPVAVERIFSQEIPRLNQLSPDSIIGAPNHIPGGKEIMTTSTKKPVFLTPSGDSLSVMPGTESPVSVDEMVRRRNAWRDKYGHLVEDYSVAEFLREKRRDVEAGLQ